MKIKFIRTLKGKVTLIIMVSIISSTVLISSFCYYNCKWMIERNLIQSTGTNLELFMKNVENNMDGVINLAKWCSNNDLISQYITEAPDNISNSKSLHVYYRLKEEFLNSKESGYIRRIIISNPKNALLQMGSTTNSSGCFTDGSIVKGLPYFNVLNDSKEFKWIGLKNDPFISEDNELNSIPIIRSIRNNNSYLENGWVYISVDKSIITDYLKDYDPEMGHIFIIINDKIYSYEDGNLNEADLDYTIENSKITDYDKNISYYIIKDSSNTSHMVICYKSSLNGWYIAQSIPSSKSAIKKEVYLPLICLVIAALFSLGIVLLFLLNKMINMPIVKINKKMKQISKGDFSYESSIESDDEIGTIGIGVNALSKNISELIDSKLNDEKQKKELEFRMLQSQINPHFLYNTLNSIKWMATIQKASGIPEMTTALARLLRNIAKGTSQLISIKEEIDLLKNYITIQQYRYGGSLNVNYNIENDDIYECKIIKFTLQPIIENSIFHGIQPKGTEGIIDIDIYKDSEKVIIEIKDNGVGMTKEKIASILNSNEESKNKDSFNNIGVYNVNERIKLTFGRQYGIFIESQISKYTKTKIVIPYNI